MSEMGKMKINVSNGDSFIIERPEEGSFFWEEVDEAIIEVLRSDEYYADTPFHISHFVDRFGNFRAKVELEGE